MTLQASGAISMSQINTELGRSSTATISLDTAENGGYATINTASTSRPNSTNPAAMSEWYSYNHLASNGTPEYWWRADSGLSTSGWTAYAGGLNFSFFNVTSANSTTGVLFNGTTGYGTTGNTTSDIDAKHILIRFDSYNNAAACFFAGNHAPGNSDMVLGNISTNYWRSVNATPANVSIYDVRLTSTNPSASSAIWFDFVNGTNVIVTANQSNTSYTMNVTSSGTFVNNYKFYSGYFLSLGRSPGVFPRYLSAYVKEVAIFTSSLTVDQVKTFRTAMFTRWP